MTDFSYNDFDFYKFEFIDAACLPSTMSSPPNISLTPLDSLSSEPGRRLDPILTTQDIHREALAMKIAEQNAKVLALEREGEAYKQDGYLIIRDRLPGIVTEKRELVSSPMTFLPTPSNSGSRGTWGELIPSYSETLQARIELQRERIRALELAVEERKRTEQLREQGR